MATNTKEDANIDISGTAESGDFHAPLPTQEIQRRKTIEREKAPKRNSQISLNSFTSDSSVGSSDPGKIVEVGNIRFLNDSDLPVGQSPILGRGAFAMVRLARRHKHQRTSSMVSGLSSTSYHAHEEFESTTTANDNANECKKRSKSFINRIEQARSKSYRSIIDNSGRESQLSSCTNDSKEQHNNVEGMLVAVKIFEKSLLEKCRTMERDNENHIQVRTALENVECEIAVMKMMQHPNLVSLFEVIDKSNRLYMVLEYLPLGEIMTNVKGTGMYKRRQLKKGEKKMEGVNSNGYFDEHHAALYFVDIMHGLAHLHKNHVVHRDLKPENILLDSRGFAKISDFGVSHLFEDEMQVNRSSINDSLNLSLRQQDSSDYLSRKESESALHMRSMSNVGKLHKTEGTWCFWSPEMCEENSLVFSGYACDIWAAGVCLHIFAMGKLPFYTEVPIQLFDMIAEAKITLEGLKLSKELKDLLSKVLAKDPSKRAGVGDILRHPFCNEARLQRIEQLGDVVEKHDEVFVSRDDMKQAFSSTKKSSMRGFACRVSKRIKNQFDSSTASGNGKDPPPNHGKRMSLVPSFLSQKTMSMDDEEVGNASADHSRTGLFSKFWKSNPSIGR